MSEALIDDSFLNDEDEDLDYDLDPKEENALLQEESDVQDFDEEDVLDLNYDTTVDTSDVIESTPPVKKQHISMKENFSKSSECSEPETKQINPITKRNPKFDNVSGNLKRVPRGQKRNNVRGNPNSSGINPFRRSNTVLINPSFKGPIHVNNSQYAWENPHNMGSMAEQQRRNQPYVQPWLNGIVPNNQPQVPVNNFNNNLGHYNNSNVPNNPYGYVPPQQTQPFVVPAAQQQIFMNQPPQQIMQQLPPQQPMLQQNQQFHHQQQVVMVNPPPPNQYPSNQFNFQPPPQPASFHSQQMPEPKLPVHQRLGVPNNFDPNNQHQQHQNFPNFTNENPQYYDNAQNQNYDDINVGGFQRQNQHYDCSMPIESRFVVEVPKFEERGGVQNFHGARDFPPQQQHQQRGQQHQPKKDYPFRQNRNAYVKTGQGKMQNRRFNNGYNAAPNRGGHDRVVEENNMNSNINNNSTLQQIIPEDENEDDRKYREKIEEQKRKREEVLRRKEESRLKTLAQQQNVNNDQRHEEDSGAPSRIPENEYRFQQQPNHNNDYQHQQQPKQQPFRKNFQKINNNNGGNFQKNFPPKRRNNQDQHHHQLAAGGQYHHQPPFQSFKTQKSYGNNIVITGGGSCSGAQRSEFGRRVGATMTQERIVTLGAAGHAPDDHHDVSTSGLGAFLNDRAVLADDTLQSTKIVVIKNLANATNESKLLNLCKGVGEVQKLQMETKDRQARIEFNSVQSAHAFYKKYRRHMVDLSMIQVDLVPPAGGES